MDQSAIAKARSRLNSAKQIIERIAREKTYQDFSDEWYLFLVAAKNIYTLLEQGAKNSAQSRQWFGSKKNFRKNDELLQYLFIARNDEEHGLDQGTEFVRGQLKFTLPANGQSTSVRFKHLISGSIVAETTNGQILPTEDIKPHMLLKTVRGRGGELVPPPTQHIGIPLSDTSPMAVARLAISYLESLIEEAATLS